MKIKRVAVLDGKLMPLEDATVSVLDRGFLYGDSVFETVRTYGGRPFALREHLERLERSAALVHIALPVSLDALELEVEAGLAASANPESYIRITVTRGAGELGLVPSAEPTPLRVVMVTELHVPPPEQYELGIAAVTFRAERTSDGTAAAGAKIGNYLVSVLSMRAANRARAAEALIVDASGHVVEGATSNVFFAEGGTIVTPPETAGILPGITRARALGVLAELGVAVVFRAPEVTELRSFDEVFVSSSIRELLAVVAIDGKPVGVGHPGPLYRKLLAAFRAKVRRDREPAPSRP